MICLFQAEVQLTERSGGRKNEIRTHSAMLTKTIHLWLVEDEVGTNMEVEALWSVANEAI